MDRIDDRDDVTRWNDGSAMPDAGTGDAPGAVTGRPAGILALQKAKRLLRTEAALARAVGVSQPAVHHMLTRGKRVPAEWCLPIERATGAQVTRHDLRPDIYPLDLDCPCAAGGRPVDR